MTDPVTAAPKKAGRNPSVDLLKIIAFIFVVTVHFTSQIGIQKEIHAGKAMFALDVLYAFSNICVALFLMATGYLMTNKKLSLSYYKGVIRVVVTYILCSVFCTACKVILYDYPNTPMTYLRHIIGFKGSDYSWYVEMYLCLFVIIPFINAAYHGMETRGKKTVLVVTVVALAALPGVLNTFNLSDPSWWSSPVSSKDYSKIFPVFFVHLYPVMYYLIGAYLREFPPKIKKRWLLLMWTLFGIAGGAYNFWRFRGGNFFWGGFMTYASILVVLIAVPFFALITSLDTSRLPEWIKKTLAYLSRLTFGAFLVAAIVDMRFYPHFNGAFEGIANRLLASPLAIAAVAAASLLISAVIDLIYRLLGLCVGAAVRLIKKKSKTAENNTEP